MSDQTGLRVLLAIGFLLLFVAVIGALRQAWRRRATQQEDDLPELLVPPEDKGVQLAAPLRGMYLGTVDAGHWLEWFAAHGVGGRQGGYVTVYEAGVQVDRLGRAFWIPREAVRGARLERAHAGKVAAPGRLIVIAWSWEGRELETGFRGEDRSRQPKVVRSVHELIGPAPPRPSEGEITSPRPIRQLAARLRPHHHQHHQHHQPGEQPPRQPHIPRPRRRSGSSRTVQQEIADRRGGLDPYGTGPRTPLNPHHDPYMTQPRVDPYVTNPRSVPYGTGLGTPPPAAPPAAPVPTGPVTMNSVPPGPVPTGPV
ncbi:MAG: hypothetical protein IRZ08_16710, partial [Frankia sp.]|nr:hypothetical protein [Frankia sp.]